MKSLVPLLNLQNRSSDEIVGGLPIPLDKVNEYVMNLGGAGYTALEWEETFRAISRSEATSTNPSNHFRVFSESNALDIRQAVANTLYGMAAKRILEAGEIIAEPEDEEIFDKDASVPKIVDGDSLGVDDSFQNIEPMMPLKFLLRVFLNREDYDVALGDLIEVYLDDAQEFGIRKARFLFAWGILRYIPGTLRNKVGKVVSGVMGFVMGKII